MPPRRRRDQPPSFSSPSDPAQSRLAIVGAARAQKVARAVISALGSAGRLGASTKELAATTRYPLRTVQRCVARLRFARYVVDTPAGGVALASVFYDLTADPGALIGFQNLRLQVTDWRTEPAPPCRMAPAAWSLADAGSAGFAGQLNLAWEGRQVTLRHYPKTDVLEVVIAAREPIPLERAGELYGWLSAMLGLGRGETTRVTQIEVNADHRDLRLEENYLEFRDLPRVSRVIYQKAEALRHEIRLHQPEGADGRPLPLERALEILTEGSPIAQARRMLREEIELEKMRIAREASEAAARAAVTATPEKALARRDPASVRPGDAAREGVG